MNLASLVWDWITRPEQWSGTDGIPERLLQHLYYSGLALLIAAAVAVPLGLWIGHTRRLGFLVVNSGNAARAMPTLGLLTLTVVVLGIGLTPVLIPLVVLAIPPILLNTYEGIRQVDADLTDAARCMGMTGRQVLFHVELPVALPLILLGLRTSAIQIVSTATIAAYVGLGGLGRFIVDGLDRREYDQMAGGAVLAVAVALGTEAAFVLLARLLVARGIHQRNTQ